MFLSYTDSTAHVPPALIPVFVIVLPLLVFFFISYFGGWWYLAKKHPFQASETGARLEKYYFCSLSLGPLGHYNNVLNITIFENGTKLSTLPLFHSPIFLRWTDIKVADGGKFFGLIRTTEIRVEDMTLSFYRSSAKAIQLNYDKYIASIHPKAKKI